MKQSTPPVSMVVIRSFEKILPPSPAFSNITKQIKMSSLILMIVISFLIPISSLGFQPIHPKRIFVSPCLHESFTNIGIDSSTFPSLFDNNIQINGRSIKDHVSILDNSLRKLTGKGIRERIGLDEKENGDIYKDFCMDERFVIVSHGTEDDPIYNFSNVAGMEAFVRSWDEFIELPSRLSVVLQTKDEESRIQLMRKVTDDGFVEGASGIRVRGDGQFIKLVDAVVRDLLICL